MQAFLWTYILNTMHGERLERRNDALLVNGEHVEIDLGDISELRERLLVKGPLQYFLHEMDQDNLPYPVTYLDLKSYWFFEQDRLPEISSTISLPPTALENAYGTWPSVILEEVEATLQDLDIGSAIGLEHDPLSLYLALDSGYAIRISLGASHNEMDITIEIVPIDEIEHATHSDILRTENYELEVEEALERLVSIVGASIDLLRNVYGKPPRSPRRYSLAVRPSRPEIPNDQPETIRDTAEIGHHTLVLAARAEDPWSPLESIDPDRVTFDTLGGLREPKEALRAIGDTFLGSDTARLYGVSPSPVILYGPSGNGKASLVQALAEYCQARLRTVDSTEILSKWQGEPAKNLDTILEEIYGVTDERVMVFFDRIDILVSGENQRDSANLRELIATLQRHLTEELPKHPNVMVVGATPVSQSELSPELIQPGIFESIHIPLPNEMDRTDIWITLIDARKRKLASDQLDENPFSPIQDIGAFDYKSLARATDGMSGENIEAVITTALKACYSKHLLSGEPQFVTQESLMDAISSMKRR